MEPTVERLRKASVTVYLAAEESVADDLSAMLSWAADEIIRLQVELKALKEAK